MQKIIILIWIILFVACGRKEQNACSLGRYTEQQIKSLQIGYTKIVQTETDSIVKIDLNPFLDKKGFDFGALVKEVKFVRLETTNKSLIGGIYDILATDTHIYIRDDFKGGSIAIFDCQGKFIKRIPQGDGPGELRRLYDIDFDKTNHELVVYQHSFLLFFSPSGKFIRQQRLPFGFFNFIVTPKGYVFKILEGGQGNGHLEDLHDYTLLVTDKDFKIKFAAMPKLRRELRLSPFNYLHNNNDNLSITQTLTDTIYRYTFSNHRLQAKYVLDYSSKKFPKSYFDLTFEHFEKLMKQKNYFYYSGDYFETKSHSMFILHSVFINKQTLFYMDKKSGHVKGGVNVEYDSTQLPPGLAMPFAASGDYFIASCNPNIRRLSHSSMISAEDKRKIQGLKEDDNPVLIFYKLKDF